MKAAEAAAALLLLLLLAIWVPLRQVEATAAAAVHVLTLLDRYSSAENAIGRDVLSARVGILRNYDPIGQQERVLDDLTGELQAVPLLGPEPRADTQALEQAADQQAGLIERFKSDNALLQNALAHVQRIADRLVDSSDPAIVAAVAALETGILRLTLDTSPAAAQAVSDRLDQLAAIDGPAEQAAGKDALLAYGRLLCSLLPATDRLLTALHATPVVPALREFGGIALAQETAAQTQGYRLRLVLYAVALVLLALLVHLAYGLRQRARALRERAAFEHAVAGASISLLNAQPDEIDGRIGDALQSFARQLGAERAYFLELGKPARLQAWCADGMSLPADWQSTVPALAAAFDPSEGIIHIPSRDRLAPGPGRNGLAEAGLRGWLCIMGSHRGEVRHILGFDALRPCRITECQDLTFARLALDVLVNASSKQALEHEKRHLATRLQQAHRMETIGALASGIAHNFNNLIGAVLGHAEMAESHIPPASPAAAHLAAIHNAGHRARTLVEEILFFGRPRDRHYATIPLAVLIDETTSLLRASLPSRIQLAVAEWPVAASVSGEFAQLQQVILNLCNNAVQAIPESGIVEIGVEIREIEVAQALDHGQLSPGRHACISVSDTGAGASPEVLRRIFEPFFTTRPTGNGLGLATVKAIVIEHGGALRVHSTPGAGCRFEVWLPCLSTEAAEVQPRYDHLETVLLIDEDRDRLYRNEEILAAIGYEPVGFTRLAEALAAYRRSPQRFDVVVCGCTALQQSLLDFAATLHESDPELPIILAAAVTETIEVPALVAVGIQDVIACPFDSAQIDAALRRSRVSALAPSG